MAAQLEDILSRLLVPDNAVIQQATQELKLATRDPSVIPALCTVLGSSANPQLRQYAAILLRRRIMKGKQWKDLPNEIVSGIRENILQLFLQEQEKSVRKALAQIAGTVAKHELPASRWPEFFNFIETHVKSSESQHRELGLYVLSVASSVATSQLQPHLAAILSICGAALGDTSNHMVPFYAIRTLTYMLIAVGTDEEAAFKALVPRILPVIQNLITVDEDLACEAMEILDELVECEVGVIVPHIRPAIEFAMIIGANKTLNDPIRIKALSFLSWLTRLKKKSVLKLKLTAPILLTLFPIMCEPRDEDDETDEELEDAEASTAPSFAAQVVDTMALHLPPEVFMPPLLKIVEEASLSLDAHTRKAALILLAVSTEGCSDYIRHKHLSAYIAIACKSVTDPERVVRNAALFSLGQFSEYLQPDISKFSSELLPLLFAQMNSASANVEKDPRGVTKLYYALEMFCENLGKEILPYLQQLMTHLLAALSTAVTTHARELAISAIGATANAAKTEIVPYFPQIIAQLKTFLAPTEDEDQLKVQMQSLDTLGVLARTMGSHFEPLAADCLNLALSLMRASSDPDHKRCVYGLLAALSTLLKEHMQPCLEEVVKEMLGSVKSVAGITAHAADATTDMLKIFDDDVDENGEQGIDEEEEEDEDDDTAGFSINNAYLNEKEDACSSLGELAVTCGPVFAPYMEASFTAVLLLLEHPGPELRKASISALGQFCIAANTLANLPQLKAGGDNTQQQAVKTMLELVLPSAVKLVKEDLDRHVAMMALETMCEMLKSIGAPVLDVTPVDILMSLVKGVLQLKIACQDQEESDGDVGEESEYDAMLIEHAGDLIPTTAKLVGGQAFAPYMAGLLPDLIKKTKSSAATPDKSFAVGTLAECVEAMGVSAATFVPILYPVFNGLVNDEDEEVRSNSCYAVGTLALAATEAMAPHFPAILKTYFNRISVEKDLRVLDNICGGFCRLIKANSQAVPMEQVLPLIVRVLPLKEDLEENLTVYSCILDLYNNNPQVVQPYSEALLPVLAEVLGSEISPEFSVEVQNSCIGVVRQIALQQAVVLQAALSSLPAEHVARLQNCLQTTNGS